MDYIDFHADDYAQSRHNSERILELVELGRLDSISILANMTGYEDFMALLSERWESLAVKPLLSVHLNYINGFHLSGREGEIQEHSWGQLFLRSFLPGGGRKQLQRELTEEFKTQIGRVYADLPEGCALRLDSHLHIHMIPVVFDAMLAAIDELGLAGELSYVRLSSEPLLMFLTTPGVAGTYPPINLVKNLILNILSPRAIRILENRGIDYHYTCGLCLSGQTDKERIHILLPKLQRFARKKGHAIEVLMHPGRMLPEEVMPETGSASDLAFLLSENRELEYEGARFRYGYEE